MSSEQELMKSITAGKSKKDEKGPTTDNWNDVLLHWDKKDVEPRLPLFHAAPSKSRTVPASPSTF